MSEASSWAAFISIMVYLIIKLSRKRNKRKISRQMLMNAVSEAVSSISSLFLAINLTFSWLTNNNEEIILKLPDGQMLLIFYLFAIFFNNLKKK